MAPYWDGSNAGRGWEPVPLTAEGLIDEGRLRRAIERETLMRLRFDSHIGDGCYPRWNITDYSTLLYAVTEGAGIYKSAQDDDLAIAFLKAVGVWTEEEDNDSAHA